MSAEVSVGAAITLGAAGLAASQMVGAAFGVEGAITVAEFAAGAIGGLFGGVMLVRAVKLRDRVDTGLAVFVSTALGAVAGPTTERIVAMRLTGLTFGDPVVSALAGWVVGAVVPLGYPVLVAVIETAKDNPKGVVQFAADAWRKLRGKG